ncbi:MAG: ABC transporter ATP-binding protein [Candidatus Levybacteria bacterium]|nr:ABC transporter ATP-binding protein [Candidatus Levybacteria bacterium]
MKNVFKLLELAKPLRGWMWGIAALIVITALLELVAPIISKSIVDEIVAKLAGKSSSLNNLIFLIVVAFAANLLGNTLSVITNRMGDHFAGLLRKFLTDMFYQKVLTLPQSYFDTEISGKIVNQLARGISSTLQFINGLTNFMLPMFLQSLFTIAVLAYYNLPVAFFTLILFPIYFVLSYYSSVRWGKEEVRKNAIEDISRSRIQEVIGNIKLVKSFSNEQNEADLISGNLQESNDIYAKQSSSFHTFDFLRGLSLNIILLLINLVVFYNTFQGILSIGEMVLIIQLVAQARRPLFAMSFILTNIQMAEAGSKEFLEILDLKSTEFYHKKETAAKVTDPTITFKHVSFKYDTSETILDDISFTIGKKEKVALVGHSGAGKSTIVNLILKFYEPTDGTMLMKDHNYNEVSHMFVRQNISLVFQENELFSTTIKENVSYGMKATEKEIIEALKKANAWGFVQKLPKGLESEVGERGVRLSGGQKQRIQIARAVLKNAPILILDEATSSLDAKSEKEVQDALEYLMKDKLVLIIAHRFSTIQNVNKIIVINDKKVEASGNPQELAHKKGIYSDLLKFQVEGNKKLLESFDIY